MIAFWKMIFKYACVGFGPHPKQSGWCKNARSVWLMQNWTRSTEVLIWLWGSIAVWNSPLFHTEKYHQFPSIYCSSDFWRPKYFYLQSLTGLAETLLESKYLRHCWKLNFFLFSTHCLVFWVRQCLKRNGSEFSVSFFFFVTQWTEFNK